MFQDWEANRRNRFAQGVLVTFRVGHLIAESKLPSPVREPLRILHRLINSIVQTVVNGGFIQPLAEIGPGLELPHSLNGIFIGGSARIGANAIIFHQVTLGQNPPTQSAVAPTIGDEVVIYSGAKVVGDVRVGDRAVIGANSLVAKDVPADALAIGVPARVIRNPREKQEYAKTMTMSGLQRVGSWRAHAA